MKVFIGYTSKNPLLHNIYKGKEVIPKLQNVAEGEDTVPVLQKGLTQIIGEISNVLTNLDGLDFQYKEKAQVDGHGIPEYIFVNIDEADLINFNNQTDYIEVLEEYLDFVPENINPERIIIVFLDPQHVNLIKRRKPYIFVK